MICFPNAKINLGLNVVSKRPDGYHNIETIFYPIPREGCPRDRRLGSAQFHANRNPGRRSPREEPRHKSVERPKDEIRDSPARDPFVESDTFWRRAWRRFRRCRFYVEAGQ